MAIRKDIPFTTAEVKLEQAEAPKVQPAQTAQKKSKGFLPVRIYRKTRYSFARSAIIRDLGELVRSAQEHQDREVPYGHVVYVNLYRRAQERLNEFCQEHGQKVEDCYADFPALIVLKTMATQPQLSDMEAQAAVTAGYIRYGIAASVVLLVTAPVGAAVVKAIYTHMVRWLGA